MAIDKQQTFMDLVNSEQTKNDPYFQVGPANNDEVQLAAFGDVTRDQHNQTSVPVYQQPNNFGEVNNFLTGEKQIHDTQEITDIWMQRPKSLVWQSLGMWFAKAHCLESSTSLHHDFHSDYKELLDFGIFTMQTKRYLVSRGLTRLPLKPLELYNQAWRDKKEQGK